MAEVNDKDGWLELVDNTDVPRLRVGDAGVVQARVAGVWTEVGGGDSGDSQPLDSDLTAIAALTTTSYGRSLLEAASAAALRTLAGLGTAAVAATGDFDAAGAAASAQLASQPLDSDLTAIAALSTTSYGRSVLASADAAALRTLAGLVIGTNVQAFDAELAALAGLTSASNKGIQFTGSETAGTYDLTTAGKALLDDADAAAQLTTLGVSTFIKTLLDDADAATARATLGIPGAELDYVEATSNVSVASTTSGTPTSIITGSAVAYDGSTRVCIVFEAPMWDIDSDGSVFLHLYDGSSDLGRIAELISLSSTAVVDYTGAPVHVTRFLTPSAATHTYSIRAHRVTGAASVYAGSGGSDTAFLPMYLRITKA